MSLRDQLLKAGLASRKDVRRVNHEQAAERRQQQGHREARAAVEAKEAQEAAQRDAEVLAQKAAERAARRAAAEAAARAHQADQILRRHRMAWKPGPQRFWHQTLDRRFLHRLDLPERLALDLRQGRVAVAAIETLSDVEYVLVPAPVAARVHATLPERILFWNETPPPPDDPAERLFGQGVD